MYALISKRPPGATWDLGASLEVNGAVVRDIPPVPRGGLVLRHDARLPVTTVLVRVEAPNGGCWSATIEDDVRDGCGSLVFPIDVEGSVSIFMERLGPAEQPITAMIEVDGQVVQTVGPATKKYPTFDIAYVVPTSG